MNFGNNTEKDIWQGYLNEMRHDAFVKQRQIPPTEADIELIGHMLYVVKSFAEAARTYGLLAVEDEASHLNLENEAEAILYEAVELIVDGCSPECVAETLSNYYWINSPEGYVATAVYIGIRSALLVQEGVNPYAMMKLVRSMLPAAIREKCIEVCRKYEAKKSEKKEEAAKAYFETDFSHCEVPEVRQTLDWLERELSFMSDGEIQRLLRDVDNMYLVQALIGMRQKTRQILARNMSSRLRAMIMEDCYQCADIEDCAIAEGAVHVAEKLKVLQACGEIMDAESRILI